MMLGHFKIIENKRVLVILQILQSMKIYNIVYLNLLHKAFIDPLTNQVHALPTSIIINNKEK